MVSLLRGINLGGNRKVPMIELRLIATKIGFSDIETYINSGNLVFDAGKMNPTQVIRCRLVCISQSESQEPRFRDGDHEASEQKGTGF